MTTAQVYTHCPRCKAGVDTEPATNDLCCQLRCGWRDFSGDDVRIGESSMLSLDIQIPERSEAPDRREHYIRTPQTGKVEVHTWMGTVTFGHNRLSAQVALSFTLPSHRPTADVVAVTWPDEAPTSWTHLAQITKQFRNDIGRPLWGLKKFIGLT